MFINTIIFKERTHFGTERVQPNPIHHSPCLVPKGNPVLAYVAPGHKGFEQYGMQARPPLAYLRPNPYNKIFIAVYTARRYLYSGSHRILVFIKRSSPLAGIYKAVRTAYLWACGMKLCTQERRFWLKRDLKTRLTRSTHSPN